MAKPQAQNFRSALCLPSHLPSRPSCEVWGPSIHSSALHLAQWSCPSLSSICLLYNQRSSPDGQPHTLLTPPSTSDPPWLLTPQCGPDSLGHHLSRRRQLAPTEATGLGSALEGGNQVLDWCFSQGCQAALGWGKARPVTTSLLQLLPLPIQGRGGPPLSRSWASA